MKTQTITNKQLMPTRQQLQSFLRSRGIDPNQLTQLSSWDLVNLTREYQQTANS